MLRTSELRSHVKQLAHLVSVHTAHRLVVCVTAQRRWHAAVSPSGVQVPRLSPESLVVRTHAELCSSFVIAYRNHK